MSFSILDLIRDQRLFGSAFKDASTWRAWQAFLAALFGLPMSGGAGRGLSGLYGPLWAS